MIRRWWHAPMCSPSGLVLQAVVILIVYAVFELAGGRAYTSILCGTPPNDAIPYRQAHIVGVSYVLVYFGALLVAPALLITAGILTLVNRWRSRCAVSGQQNA
jgi:hypothetical protein